MLRFSIDWLPFRATGCVAAGLVFLAGCTETYESTVKVYGKDYKLYHTYTTGKSLRLGNVNSYTIEVDGTSFTCDSKEACVQRAQKHLNANPDVGVPPLLEPPKPVAKTPPPDDGVPELLKRPEPRIFGD